MKPKIQQSQDCGSSDQNGTFPSKHAVSSGPGRLHTEKHEPGATLRRADTFKF